MRQNWKIHIKFGVFKSKRLEWVWRVLVWEKKVRTLYNIKLPNEEKSDIKLTKTLRSVMKGRDMGEDSVRRLPGSLLAHYILDD